MATMPVKPIGCPLCGRRPSVGKGGPNDLFWYVGCNEQEGHTVTVTHLGTRNEAMTLWNTRTRIATEELGK